MMVMTVPMMEGMVILPVMTMVKGVVVLMMAVVVMLMVTVSVIVEALRVLVAAVHRPASGGISETSSGEFLRTRIFYFLCARKC